MLHFPGTTLYTIITKKQHAFLKPCFRQASKWTDWTSSPRAEFIVLPDVPEKFSTATSRPGSNKSSLPKARSREFIDQDVQSPSLQGMKLFASTSRHCMDVEMLLNDHCSQLAKKTIPNTFEGALAPVDSIFTRLNEAFFTAHSALAMQGSAPLNVIIHSLHRKVRNTNEERFTNEELYKACLEIDKNRNQLTDVQRGYLDFHLRQFHANGMKLSVSEKASLRRFREELKTIQQEYRARIAVADRTFSLMLNPEDLSASTPYWLRKQLAAPGSRDAVEKGPWHANVSELLLFNETMKYIVDFRKRWLLYRGRAMRTGNYSSPAQGGLNLSNLMEIRKLRHRIAKALGYRDWASWYCQERTKFGSLSAVTNYLDELRRHHTPLALQEYETLTKWAEEKLGFSGQLKLWDLPFITKHYQLDRDGEGVEYMEPNAQYLPQSHIIQSLPRVLSEVFGVRITPVSSSTTPMPCLIPTAKGHLTLQDSEEPCELWQVRDESDTRPLGWIVVDIWPRHQKDAMVTRSPMSYALCHRDEQGGQLPVSYIVASWHSKSVEEGVDDGLSPQQVAQLWACGVMGLQQVLSNSTHVPYSELAAPASSTTLPLWQQPSMWVQPLDCHHVLQTAMQHLVYRRPDLLAMLGRHLDVHTAKDLLQGASAFGSSLQMTLDCYRAAMELEFHVSDKYYHDVQCNLWADWLQMGGQGSQRVQNITKVLAPEAWDEWPCSDVDLFSYNCETTKLPYVTQLCMNRVLLEVMDSFVNSQFMLSVVGRRFRESYLSYGAALDENELLKRFKR